jgi:REP element-mobilizing transposase RayT
MGRAPRDLEYGGIYHVYSRGSNRQAIFRFDTDRIDFLKCLERVILRYDLTCLAYCLMPNHFHLVVETPDARLSQAMKALNGRYSLRFNRRHRCDAHLFKNRFGAVLQSSESQLLWTLRYTVRNPVETGMCSRPEEWPWSSYRATVGIGQAPVFLAITRLLSYFGDTSGNAVARYEELMASSTEVIGV